MKINDFKLEVFFGQHEFSAPYLLAQSDCQTMTINELLDLEPGGKEMFLESSLGYTKVEGSEELVCEISKLYKNCGPRDILVHAGAQEPIYNFMNVLLDEGDHVISQFPIYQSIYEVPKAIKCNVSYWELKQSEDGWFIDFNELEDLIQDNTKLICVNSPNNPTGYMFNEEEMKKLAEIAKEHEIYILADEVYHGLELDNSTTPWFADIYEKAVSIGVMSKAYGLPGLRIGWVASRDEFIIDKMTKMKHYTTICSSGPSEVLATVALKHGEKLLERNKNIIRKNIETANSFFDRFPDLFLNNEPKAGPIAYHKMNIDQPINEFCEKMIEDAGVLLLSGAMYDQNMQYFRMGYGRSDFSSNLKKFEEYLLKHF